MSKIILPKWFYPVTVVALLWNLMGIANFLLQLNLSPEDIAALPAAEQDLMNNTPLWSMIAFALGVFGGSIGCIGLLIRKAWSKVALLIALLAVTAQMSYWLFFTSAVEVYGPSTYGMPLLVIFVALLLVRLSNNGIKKGYLV